MDGSRRAVRMTERRWSDAHAASHVRPGGQAPAGREGGSRARSRVRGAASRSCRTTAAAVRGHPEVAHGGDRADARPREGRPSRLDRGATRGRRADRARRPTERGKSSLLQALSQIQIKTGDYAFTTTRPIAAVTSVGGVRVQLVEIPGLLEGASEGRGGGRALLGVLRNADAIVYCHAASAPPEDLNALVARSRRRHRAARSARGDQGGRGRRARRPSRGPHAAISSSCPFRFSTTRASSGSARRSGACSGSIRVYLR